MHLGELHLNFLPDLRLCQKYIDLLSLSNLESCAASIIKFVVYNVLFSKGISKSALPYRRSVPTWLKLTPEDVKDHIFKLAKKGSSPSQIGSLLNSYTATLLLSQFYVNYLFIQE